MTSRAAYPKILRQKFEVITVTYVFQMTGSPCHSSVECIAIMPEELFMLHPIHAWPENRVSGREVPSFLRTQKVAEEGVESFSCEKCKS
ncbi:hypothetical protein V6N12_022435 [Hibiscus sabdariffa]|uniref:Uncharacterized protein n=1 Tax=Hibiscus sabdariffa TaxID=183260 RepID=A0ABR2FUP2_9ROSI